MISALLFMNAKGEVLISRIYRDDVGRGIADAFKLQVVQNKEVRSPVKCIGTTTFCHVKLGQIFVVAVTRQNINVGLIFEVLYKIINIFKAYFGGNMDEEGIRNNFVLIYELLDEIMDFGYPQNFDTDVLKLYITQKGEVTEGKANKEKLDKITIRATGAVSWRSPDIKYRKNEIYIDVVESVNLLMSDKGNILRADVSGQILMKCYLSGMPECKFGLNDRLLLEKEAKSGTAPARAKKASGIELDDCTFHQCVKLGKWDTDRTISFVPPDGEFELMKYRTTENINLPFRIIPIVKEVGRTRVEVKVSIKSNFSGEMFGSNIKVVIPCPKNTAKANITTAAGRARYTPEADAIVWKLRRFPGDTEYSLSAEVLLMATIEKKMWSRPPISMEFQVPMFTSSGLHVRFLKVIEKSHYSTVKWVRYLTQAGSYQCRV